MPDDQVSAGPPDVDPVVGVGGVVGDPGVNEGFGTVALQLGRDIAQMDAGRVKRPSIGSASPPSAGSGSPTSVR